jgi:hypothetical protein
MGELRAFWRHPHNCCIKCSTVPVRSGSKNLYLSQTTRLMFENKWQRLHRYAQAAQGQSKPYPHKNIMTMA